MYRRHRPSRYVPRRSGACRLHAARRVGASTPGRATRPLARPVVNVASTRMTSWSHTSSIRTRGGARPPTAAVERQAVGAVPRYERSRPPPASPTPACCGPWTGSAPGRRGRVRGTRDPLASVRENAVRWLNDASPLTRLVDAVSHADDPDARVAAARGAGWERRPTPVPPAPLPRSPGAMAWIGGCAPRSSAACATAPARSSTRSSAGRRPRRRPARP